MSEVLFSPADLAEMRAFNEANLPHSAAIESGTRSYAPNAGGIVWNTAVPVATEPCRISPATTPQEQQSAGVITEVKEFWVIMRHGASVPVDDTVSGTIYRIRVTHTIPGIPSPLPLYVKGTSFRTYEMMRKVLCTTVGPQ